MNHYLVALLLTLVGVYIAHSLSKSYGRWKDKRRTISEFAELLRHTLPEIRQGVIDAYLFSNDLNQYFIVLKENELKLGYQLLPNNVKVQIKATSDALNELVLEFRKLSKHLYPYFENMENKEGQGFERMNTIVATKLLCLEQNELPSEKTLINFPREMRSHFSQVQCQPHQVAEIWALGQKGNAKLFIEKRDLALERVNKLEEMLSRFQRVW